MHFHSFKFIILVHFHSFKFIADLRMYHRFYVIVLGACVRVCMYVYLMLGSLG